MPNSWHIANDDYLVFVVVLFGYLENVPNLRRLEFALSYLHFSVDRIVLYHCSPDFVSILCI